jgi:hypothetical protein
MNRRLEPKMNGLVDGFSNLPSLYSFSFKIDADVFCTKEKMKEEGPSENVPLLE